MKQNKNGIKDMLDNGKAYLGKRCIYGHVHQRSKQTARYVSNGVCIVCSRAYSKANNDYNKGRA